MLKLSFIYCSLVFAELTTICKNLKNKVGCPLIRGGSKTFLNNARSVDACPSECERAGNGAKGCCEWQHDWKMCMWTEDVRRPLGATTSNRSAVMCSSK